MDTFPQARETDLIVGSQTFEMPLASMATAIGLSPAQVTAFDDLQAAFALKYALVQDPATRTPTNVIAKNEARQAMVDNARMLIKIIQANPLVTDEQRRTLNITIRKARTSQSTPNVEPLLEIDEVNGHTL